jgi:hypothetical protein
MRFRIDNGIVNDAGLDAQVKGNRVKLRLTAKDLPHHQTLLRSLVQQTVNDFKSESRFCSWSVSAPLAQGQRWRSLGHWIWGAGFCSGSVSAPLAQGQRWRSFHLLG